MSAETPMPASDDVSAAAAAVAAAGARVPARDWLATGTGAFDRYSSAAPDALVAIARGEEPGRPPHRFCPLGAAIGFTVGAWSKIRAAKRAMRGRTFPSSADHVIRTWAGPPAFRDGRFADPYFGPLADRLGEAGLGVVTVVGALSEHARVYADAAGAGVLPEHLFLGWWDPVAVAIGTLRHRPSVASGVDLAGRDVSALVRACVDEEHGRRQVFANRLQARIGRRIAERLKPRAVALTHEGYAWERQFVLGIKDASPRAWVVGWQHAPIAPAQTALRMVPGPDAGSPDRVVTAGEAGADELARRGYPRQLVAVGGALKVAPPARDVAAARHAAAGDVLVVLGDFDRGLRAAAALRGLPALVPGRRVVLRLHPLTPPARFVAALGFDPSEAGMTLSAGGPLGGDLETASAVIYDASLVALEAVAAGVPALHLDLGDALSSDPMVGSHALHAEATDAAGVASALDAFAALSDDDFARQAAEARAFVRSVLGEADAGCEAFLPPEGEQR